jgi:tRNA(adenine34) deaminase
MIKSQLEKDQAWMWEALKIAKKGEKNNEVPVGAILVNQEKVIARAYNSPIKSHDPSAHAEIKVLRLGAKKIKNYRLIDATLYVTVEPCLMCLGAILNARVKRLVFGAYQPKTGSIVSTYQIPHHLEYRGGVLKKECAQLIKDFFKKNCRGTSRGSQQL